MLAIPEHKRRLLSWLLAQKHITHEEYTKASIILAVYPDKIVLDIIGVGKTPEIVRELYELLSAMYNVPILNTSAIKIHGDTVRLIPKEVAENHTVMPIRRSGTTLILAMAETQNATAIDDCKFITGLNVEPILATADGIRALIQKHYMRETALPLTCLLDDEIITVNDWPMFNLDELDVQKTAEEAPVVRLVNMMLMDAIKREAEEIHVEIFEKRFQTRCVINGVGAVYMTPPLKLRNAIAARLKIMAGLDIADKTVPQTGTIRLTIGANKHYEFFVSTLPTVFGEKIFLRRVQRIELKALEDLGMPIAIQEKLVYLLLTGNPGLILLSGPPQSGQTTLLYALMSKHVPSSNFYSVEPCGIQHPMDGVVQIAPDLTKRATNLSQILQAVSCQHPTLVFIDYPLACLDDIVAVLKLAEKTKVIACTPTTSIAATLRHILADLKGNDFTLLAQTLRLVLNMRVAEKLCQNCRVQIEPTPKEQLPEGLRQYSPDSIQTFDASGCDACNGKGLPGFVQICSALPCDQEWITILQLPKMKHGKNLETAIRQIQSRQNLQSIEQEALNSALRGQISLKELFRIV